MSDPAREEGARLALDWTRLARAGAGPGLLPVAVQDSETREVLLLAFTNEEAFRRTLSTRRLILWSVSRNELWEKGATSGERFELVEARVNCEQNSLLYRVRPLRGRICHTRNRAGQPRNCFYRRIDPAGGRLENLDP